MIESNRAEVLARSLPRFVLFASHLVRVRIYLTTPHGTVKVGDSEVRYEPRDRGLRASVLRALFAAQ
jgi:hypothetical protein